LAEASLESTNFWDCPFDLCASALSHHQINPVRGSQIGKTKLSIRKAEERHSKEGQEGRKEAPQAPALRSISAFSGDEVSHYDQTQEDNWPHAKRCSDETSSATISGE
jgi:hypothetical protein